MKKTIKFYCLNTFKSKAATLYTQAQRYFSVKNKVFLKYGARIGSPITNTETSMLKITKQLSAPAAAKIRQLRQKELFLTNLKDSQFLYEDLLARPENKTFIYEDIFKANPYYRILLNKDIGPFLLPAFRLKQEPENFCYAKYNKAQKIRKKFLEIVLLTSSVDDKKAGISFSTGDGKNSLEELDFAIAKNKDIKILLSLAKFFYNKKTSYERVKALLSARKESLMASTGILFTEDLISLFSANSKEEAFSNFELPKINTSCQLIKTVAPNYIFNNDSEYLGFFTTKVYNYRYGVDIKIGMYLGKDNTLVLEASAKSIKDEVYSILEGVYQAILKRNKRFSEAVFVKIANKLVEEQLDNWLNNLEQMTSFGIDIYDILKTKIFLNNT